ncbi:MAG: hypothetical protein A3G47_03055 [Candidatus Zambryskibacteria bacterium RIFCSPLOWO2_12_FULL_39_45]|uniref:Glycosyl transferase family 1 domain-containing protein n=3 Tax=Candidatus Zambryskiibacteriota TaxID=1817925 RepID=A0A1G2T6Y2_9BACT|nr:MAG: hypothetical protein A2W58_00930 [Candidatus Zambryskibacteria bacterium RIFCSPHIGHO2_02_38_10.5]OHA99028.1 MAG: hypothetical protein A3E32_00045 [Candidatus Zambryskibacteria bacterium RIFCSPHIGHO2_12_FULL_38_37]OHB09003.1 MAG: hypothetical protein A2W64_01290 [Candidatus Zambryskibacteria bacterium RIFCSPLOWO2_02_39_10]OHB13205.1 MAG: hypothetical protein A2Y49_03110 [Candidatus Zambryskibacteria bacterium RIFCSPLOWO2_12_39_8]OHB14519.1 MAG: hypothetical protein A3G47_03055 [Candidatu
MRRVLFICSLYHPHIGGIETMVTELSRFYRGQGIESVILTKKWPTTLTEEDDYKDTKIYRVVSARTETEFNNIIEWAKNNENKIKADIIHVIGVRRPLPLIGLLLSRHWNVPLISTIAGSEIPNTGDSETETVWNESKEIMRPVLESSSIVTCVSKALENDLRGIVPNLNYVRTVYAGIDTEFINSVSCTETEKNYIVSLRRLTPSKGVDILIRAFKDIANEYPQIRLLIAGEGHEEENLKTLARNLNLDDKIKFIGTVSLTRAISLLKGAICTVVPSISEGGSLVNIEAQAASCPVVASRVGGIPEYVQDGVSGLLFESRNLKDLADKVKIIISNAPLRNKLIQGGVEHANKFSWDILGPQYLALYNEMIDVKQIKSFQPWSRLTKRLWLKLK